MFLPLARLLYANDRTVTTPCGRTHVLVVLDFSRSTSLDLCSARRSFCPFGFCYRFWLSIFHGNPSKFMPCFPFGPVAMRRSVLDAGRLVVLTRLSGLLLGRPHLCRKTAWQRYTTGAVRGRATSVPAPVLTATPTRALMDEPLNLEARHLTPRRPVTVRARMRCEDDDLWEALAHYCADEDGILNLSRDESQGGSYSGREPMGLFWSLLPAPGGREGLRLRKKNVETPYTVQVSLLDGHVSSDRISSHDEGQGKGEELASVTIERWYTAPGVRRIDIREQGLVGTLFLPPGPGPFPAILDMYGMGGGLLEYRAALLASRGIVSFALAYFGHKDIPGPLSVINVGDDYFQAAFQLLQNHPQVCGSRIAVIGLSYGSYLTLRIATKLPVNPRCIIAINGPIGSIYEGIEAKGKVIRFGPSYVSYSADLPGYVDFREPTHPESLPASTRIKIEDLRCPLLLLTSEDDLNADVLESAKEIKKGLEAANKLHLLTWVLYPGAGHLIEPPFSPHARSSLWSMKPEKLMVLWGGHTAPHAAAQEDAWKKVLEFLDRHLRGRD